MGLTDRRGLQRQQTINDALMAGGRLTLRVGPKGDIAAAGPPAPPEPAEVTAPEPAEETPEGDSPATP